MNKKFLLLFTSIVLFVCVGRIGFCKRKNNDDFIIEDFLGRKISFQKTPDKVISTAPNITEIIYALEADDKLIGVSNWCDYPPEAKQKPKIGDFSHPVLEKIMKFNPDVIFATPQKETPTLDRFEQMGLKVVCIHPKTFQGVIQAIEMIGNILDKPATADSITTMMRNQKNDLSQPPDSLRVYVEIYKNPLMTVSRNSLLGEMIEIAGGKNIASDLPMTYPTINAEKVVHRNPDVIITTYPTITKSDIENRLGWEHVSAIENGFIFTNIDPNILLRPTHRTIHGIKTLNQIFIECSSKGK